MYCRWCGMESRTKDRCEWCHRPLTDREERPLDERDRTAPWKVPPEAPKQRKHDPDLTRMDQLPVESAFDALTESHRVVFGEPEPEGGGAAEQEKAPTPAIPGEWRPAPQRAEESGTAAAARFAVAPSGFGYRLEKFLALAGITAALAMAITRLAPAAWWPVGAAALFLCGLFMATTGCGAAFEDQYVGVVALLSITLLAGTVGPIAAPFGYLLVGLVFRMLSPTVLGLGFMNLIITGLLVAAYSGSAGSSFFAMGDFYDQSQMYVYFSFMLATLGGWVSSSLLLPLNE